MTPGIYDEGDVLDVTVEGHAIVLRPGARRYSLDELLKGISSKNRHPETAWGAPVGKEDP